MSGLRLDVRWKGGSGRPHDVVARVWGVDVSPPGEGMHEIVVPASRSTAAQLLLPAGRYLVQVSLPSGELLQERFDVGAEGTTPVTLEVREQEGRSKRTEPPAPPEAASPKWTGKRRYGAVQSRPAAIAPTGTPVAEAVRTAARWTEPRLYRLQLSAAPNLFSEAGFGSWTRPEEVLGGFSGNGADPARLRLEPSGTGHKLVQQRSAERADDVRVRTWILFGSADALKAASLPLPWPDQLDGRPANIHLSLGRRRGTRAVLGSIAITDGAFGGLLEYLGKGHLGAAAQLAETLDFSRLAGEGLERFANPLGACAAAYAGLGVLDSRKPPNWLDVLPRLRRNYRWLPDGAVVEARYRMSSASGSETGEPVFDLLKEAFARGVPYYTAGVLHLREMLYAFSQREDAKAMFESVSAVALRLEPGQAFTTLRYRASAR